MIKFLSLFKLFIILMDSQGKSSRKEKELIQAVYDVLTDENAPDEKVIALFEEALFMFSDVVMSNVYSRLYNDGKYNIFGRRFNHLSRLVGELWSQPESKKLIPKFIKGMNVNVSELEKDPSDFISLNAFFARPVNLNKRPFENGAPDSMSIYSPSDGVVLAYQNLDRARKHFIKGKKFTLDQLLDNDEKLISLVKGGAMIIIRLRPRDVHRIHSPLKSQVGTPYWAGTQLNTVKVNIIARPDVDVFVNNIRLIMPLHNNLIDTYVLIAIGAPLIGSVVMTVKPGDMVEPGQEIGYFQYGGSTIILLLPPDLSIEWKITMDKPLEAESPTWIRKTLGVIQ